MQVIRGELNQSVSFLTVRTIEQDADPISETVAFGLRIKPATSPQQTNIIPATKH